MFVVNFKTDFWLPRLENQDVPQLKDFLKTGIFLKSRKRCLKILIMTELN